MGITDDFLNKIGDGAKWVKNNTLDVVQDLAEDAVEFVQPVVQKVTDVASEVVSPITNSAKNVVDLIGKENLKETIDLGVKGVSVVVNEALHNPTGCVENMYNLGKGLVQRATYSPIKTDNIPDHIEHPVIFAIYRVGHNEAFPGHAALWFEGETIDATSYGAARFSTMFHNNKGVIGENVSEWVDNPFVYDISDKCDLYVVDAKDLGYDTPEKRAQFKQRIIETQKQVSWDLNNSNCAYYVNMVTEDQFVRVERPKDDLIKNFDFPLMIGASLDERCQSGSAFALTPQAIQHYGLALSLEHEKSRVLASQTHQAEDLVRKLNESQDSARNVQQHDFARGFNLFNTVDDENRIYKIQDNGGQNI